MNTTATFRTDLVLKDSAVRLRGHQGAQKGRVLKVSRKGVATVMWTDKHKEQIVVDALELWHLRYNSQDEWDIREDLMYSQQWDPNYQPRSGCGSP